MFVSAELSTAESRLPAAAAVQRERHQAADDEPDADHNPGEGAGGEEGGEGDHRASLGADLLRALNFGPMASPEAKNLEAISKAIDQHNANCPFPAAEVRMNPFEIERLGWETIRGLPLLPDPELGTGRFRIVCSRDTDDSGLEITEAVGKELETVAPSHN